MQSCKTWKNFAPRAAKKSRKLLRAPHEFPPQISGGKSWAKRGFCRQTRPMRAKRCNPATRSPPDSNGEKNHRRPQETGAAKPKEICESILTLRAEFPAHSAITCPVRGLKNHFATRAFVEKRAGIPRARRRAGNNTCKCRSVTQIFNGAELSPKNSRAGKLKRRIPPRLSAANPQ